eukprot:CAMPEP_0117001118 /NCGR_PEP_ID=MMETSP0472-20121206/3227_1 /TAXON_ID=693140 ORGANISM="Tiarina fusus, Strain LIS" /NCGR_SAMPLE_ID=MMETSP0472 /ASSEMBLY_ACC=CAM_ASM_000603 /LENGTH=467 /DNA_ID=CAMNT_0004701025 /DNA_START=105 /DNA_END=1511 /DNA_ORIENTATION=+
MLSENRNVLALFTRLNPNCPECSIASDAIASLKYEDEDLVAVTVDCDTLTQICRKYELDHLPKVLLFNEDVGIYEYKEVYVYLEALEQFVAENIAPKTQIIHTQEELDELTKGKLVVVGFFHPTENQKERGSFRRTAGQLFKEYTFVEVLVDDDQAPVMKNNDVSLGSLKIFKRVGGELSEIFYDEEAITRRRITNWIDQNSPWDVREIKEGSAFSDAKDFFREYPILTTYLDYSNEESTKQIILALETVAEDFREKIVFTYMNGNEDKYKDAFSRWGFTEGKLPIMMIVKQGSGDIFTFSGHDLNHKEIGMFCDDFLKGNLEPHVIKQEVPEVDPNQAVQVIVHDSWRSIVHATESDVVVFFYLPLSVCDHCIPFLEKYETVAEKLKDIPGLVLAKIDMHANAQVPGIRVANFPTIQLYPKSNKFQEIIYSGPRTEEAVRTWIMNNLSEKHNSFSEEEQRLLGDVI